MKNYPKIDIREIGSEELPPRSMELSSWVRIFRKGDYYNLLVTNIFPLHEHKHDLTTINMALDRFHDFCLINKYTWVLPKTEEGIQTMIDHKTLQRDISHLTDKEEFLLNFRS